MNIDDNQSFFVQLWLQLERTRHLFGARNKRFCPRNILREWFGGRANDDFIREVCNSASNQLDEEEPLYGWDEMPPPKLAPRLHREFLRAVVAHALGIGMRKVNLRALDCAFSQAFKTSKNININKKKPLCNT